MKIDKSTFCLITLTTSTWFFKLFLKSRTALSFLHELMQWVCSSPPHLQNQHHKCCIWKVSFLHELLLHVYSNCFYLKNSYHKSRSSISSITYTTLKIVFFSKTTNAKVTLHFPSFMNWCIESFQVQLTYKTSITNVAFERFLSFMNCCYMFIQIAFSSEINSLPI